LLAELSRNPVLRPLRQARHLVVNFEGDGAAWIDFSDSDKAGARLVFDPAHAEGEWGGGISGDVFGYETCLAAAVAHALASPNNTAANPDFLAAIERGLSAMRNLRAEGHGIAQSQNGDFHPGRDFRGAAC